MEEMPSAFCSFNESLIWYKESPYTKFKLNLKTLFHYFLASIFVITLLGPFLT